MKRLPSAPKAKLLQGSSSSLVAWGTGEFRPGDLLAQFRRVQRSERLGCLQALFPSLLNPASSLPLRGSPSQGYYCLMNLLHVNLCLGPCFLEDPTWNNLLGFFSFFFKHLSYAVLYIEV